MSEEKECDPQIVKLFGLLNCKRAVIRREAETALANYVTSSLSDRCLSFVTFSLEALKSPDWILRQSCAVCMALVMRHVLMKQSISCMDTTDQYTTTTSDECLTTQSIQTVLNTNHLLFATDSKTYSKVAPIQTAAQRQQIDRLVGLDTRVGVTSKDWIADSDIDQQDSSSLSSMSPSSQSADDTEQNGPISIQAHSQCINVHELIVYMTSGPLNSPIWEHRHGAALLLKRFLMLFRERLDGQAGNAMLIECTPYKGLIKIIVHAVLKVLICDRVFDYSMGECVCPVRELCAQVLVLCYSMLDADWLIVSVRSMIGYSSVWEVQHSALLVLRYLATSHAAQACELVPPVLNILQLISESDCKQDNHNNDDELIAAATNALLALLPHKLYFGKFTHDLMLLLPKMLDRTKQNAACDLSWTSNLLQVIACCLSENQSISDIGYIDLLCCCVSLSQVQSCAHTRTHALHCIQLLMNAICDGNMALASHILLSVYRSLYRQLLVESFEHMDLVERMVTVSAQITDRLTASVVTECLGQVLLYWITPLLMPNTNLPLDLTMLHLQEPNTTTSTGSDQSASSTNTVTLCGSAVRSLAADKQVDVVVQRKLMAAQFLAPLIMASDSSNLMISLRDHLMSNSANERLGAGLCIMLIGRSNKGRSLISDELLQLCHTCLNSPNVLYNETALLMAGINKQCSAFLTKCAQAGVQVTNQGPITSIESARVLCAQEYEKAKTLLTHRKRSSVWLSDLTADWVSVCTCLSAHGPDLAVMHQRIQVVLVAALVCLEYWPPKLNPLIRPLVQSISVLRLAQFVQMTAHALARLLRHLVDNKQSLVAVDKVLGNVQLMAAEHVAQLRVTVAELDNQASTQNNDDVIRSQHEQEQSHTVCISACYINTKSDCLLSDSAMLQKNNAAEMLRAILVEFGGSLERLTVLQNILEFKGLNDSDVLCSRLTTASIVLPDLLPECQGNAQWLNDVCELLMTNSDVCVRYCSARLLVTVAKTSSLRLCAVLDTVLPRAHQLLRCPPSDQSLVLAAAAGCVDWLYMFVSVVTESADYVCLCSVLCSLALAYMSHWNTSIRVTAAHVFALLVQIMPLQIGKEKEQRVSRDYLKSALTNQLSANVQEIINKSITLFTLLDNPQLLTPVNTNDLGVCESIKLRDYQRQGVTWMCALNDYHLHGLLADDMGLGKTLQTLCVIAYSHQKVVCADSAPSTSSQSACRSLIVCPRTLVAHWLSEVHKFWPTANQSMRPVAVTKRLNELDDGVWRNCNIVVTSYDTLRRDASFSAQHWHYCVLDEGHVMRNHNTQLYKAVSALHAQHRLLLTGTPVQNSVCDLWVLFTWLMPGYLGTQQSFNAKYLKPIVQQQKSAKGNQSNVLELQEGSDQLDDAATSALAQLHKLVCDLSAAQREMYVNYVENLHANASQGKPIHALQAITYLRKLCAHPCLVKDIPYLVNEKMLQESGKLLALRQLLIDFDIATSSDEQNQINQTNSSNADSGSDLVTEEPHRCLVFCQLRCTVQIVAEAIDKGLFGTKTKYMRLDGTVPAAQRQSVADRFNKDTSIQILLLTTQIGGLGLTLTGADLVVMLEQDWNPCRDLQAVDRAHRLGQRRAVLVYTVCCKGTLEYNIHTAQTRKTQQAKAIIGEENSDSFRSMGTGQLLELLSLNSTDSQSDAAQNTRSDTSTAPQAKKRKKTAAKSGANQAVDGDGDAHWDLDALWQYETETSNLATFAKALDGQMH